MAMTLTITLSDAHGQRVVEAYTNTRGFVAGQGESAAAFTKRMIIEDIRSNVQRYEHNEIQQQAVATAPPDIAGT